MDWAQFRHNILEAVLLSRSLRYLNSFIIQGLNVIYHCRVGKGLLAGGSRRLRSDGADSEELKFTFEGVSSHIRTLANVAMSIR
jgi:hypothetical protein